MAVPPFLVLENPLGNRPNLRDRQSDPVADLAVALNLPFFGAGQGSFLEQDPVRNPHLAEIMILRQQPDPVDPVRRKSGGLGQPYANLLHPAGMAFRDMVPFFQQPDDGLDDRRTDLGAAAALLPIHIAVRFPEQAGQIHLAALADRRTDRHTQQKLVGLGIRFRHEGPQPPDRFLHNLRRRLRQQHDELVAADPGHHIAIAERLGQQIRRFLEQAVAEQMAEAVVIQLQAVDIADDHRDRRIAAVVQTAQLLLEIRPVVQAGQRIPHAVVNQFFFHLFAVGDIRG